MIIISKGYAKSARRSEMAARDKIAFCEVRRSAEIYQRPNITYAS